MANLIFGAEGIQQDLRPVLRNIEPKVYALEYPSILQGVSVDVDQTPPDMVDMDVTSRFVDVNILDVKAARHLINNSGIKKYTVGVKDLTYRQQLFRIVNEAESVTLQPQYVQAALAQTISYLTMQFDSFPFYDNHNMSVLNKATVVTPTADLLETLNRLVMQYKQYNLDDEPVVFCGFEAYAKLMTVLKSVTPTPMFMTGMNYLESVIPTITQNLRMVNEYVLNFITEGAAAVGSTNAFTTNDILLINPKFSKLWLGLEPSTVQSYSIGSKLVTDHLFSTPSLQMVKEKRAFIVDIENSEV